MELRVVSNTGAYGNHGAGGDLPRLRRVIAVYRCPNKKVDGYAVYTHTVPAGAFRGYGLGQMHLRRRVGAGRTGPAASAWTPSPSASATSSGPAIP